MKSDHAASMVRNRERAHEIYLQRRLGDTIAKDGANPPSIDEVARAWGKTEVRAEIDGWTLDTLKAMTAERKLVPPEGELPPPAQASPGSAQAHGHAARGMYGERCRREPRLLRARAVRGRVRGMFGELPSQTQRAR